MDENINENISSVKFKSLVGKYMPTNSIFSKVFYIKRGYSKKEAQEIVKELQSSNVSKRTYKRTNNPRCIEFYIEKGLSEEEASKELSLHQSKNSKRSLYYWTSKGYSESEAKKEVSLYQDNSEHIDYLKRSSSWGNMTIKWLNRNPNREKVKARIYYLEFEDNNTKYWKIGITSNTYEQRFAKKVRDKYKMNLLYIEEASLREIIIKEKEILEEFKNYRVKTSLTTESFTKNILINKLVL